MTEATLLNGDAPPASPPAAPPAPPAKPVKTAVAVEPAAVSPPEPPTDEPPAGDKPFDWRKAIAGDDDKLYKELERTADLKQLHKRLTDTQKELRDQGRVKIPGKDATDEDKATFAKALGIPKDAASYKIKPTYPEGMKFDDADKALLKDGTEKLYAKGGFAASPEVVTAFHELYADIKESSLAQLVAAGVKAHADNEKALKGEWKGNFKAEMDFANAGFSHLANSGEEVDAMRNLQLADGTKLGDYTPFIKMMNKAGRLAGQDPLFAATSALGGSATDWQARKTEIMALRNGTPDQRKEYARLSAPGGELQTLVAKLDGSKKAA